VSVGKGTGRDGLIVNAGVEARSVMFGGGRRTSSGVDSICRRRCAAALAGRDSFIRRTALQVPARRRHFPAMHRRPQLGSIRPLPVASFSSPL